MNHFPSKVKSMTQQQQQHDTVPPPVTSCYCGASTSMCGQFCSQGCDYSGLTLAEDEPDMALDSGCECGHHKCLKFKKIKRRKTKS
jgi:hypothetical protein